MLDKIKFAAEFVGFLLFMGTVLGALTVAGAAFNAL